MKKSTSSGSDWFTALSACEESCIGKLLSCPMSTPPVTQRHRGVRHESGTHFNLANEVAKAVVRERIDRVQYFRCTEKRNGADFSS